MIEVTEKPISLELVVDKVKTDSSGCVTTYVGLIRKHSRGKPVLSVEYEDVEGEAVKRFREIINEIGQQWKVNDIAICHRIGKLKIGDVNLVIAVASTHREEGFAACRYAVDQFKRKLPTHKKETYEDGSVWVE